jgi:hypothetical protein
VIDWAAIFIGSAEDGRLVFCLVAVGVLMPAGIWSRSCRLMQRRTVVGMAAEVNVRLCRLIG